MWYFIVGFICFWIGYFSGGLMAASSYASRLEEMREILNQSK